MAYPHYDAVMRTCPGMPRPDDEQPYGWKFNEEYSFTYVQVHVEHPAFLDDKPGSVIKEIRLLCSSEVFRDKVYAVITHYPVPDDDPLLIDEIQERILPF